MNTKHIERLREHAEQLVALSLSHLTPDTRQKLQQDNLSVNAYPTDFGGFIYVGTPPYRMPTEDDLISLFKVAADAGIDWLKFDSESPIIEGLALFEPLTDPDA